MKKIFLFLFVLFSFTILSAQNIVVESFLLLETDLTANMEGSIVYDQNGEKCALIKVRSNPPTKGFSFDVGHLGVMKVEIKGAETWLYVPHGVRKISIQHEQLGFLDNYDLGMPVKRATTYQLNLRVGRVQTIVEEQLMKQFLMFRLNPKDAVVEVAGDPWIPNADGVCRKMLSYGTYDYRVEAKDYHIEVGKVTLNNADETKVIEVDLRPAYGWIEVKGIGDLTDAVVYVDNKMIGRVPVKTDKLSSGRHSVRIVKDLFRAHIEDVIVSDNQIASISPTLIGEFSNVSITTKSGAEIWVDGELKGISSWSGRLSFGEHLMEAKQASHRSQSRVVNILATESTKSVQLPEPQPIYGSLSVEVLPDFADVYVDGQKVGQTPKILSKILIGEHTVEVRAEDKDPLEKNITISEGVMSTITGELKNETPKNPSELVFNVKGVQFTMKYVEGGTFTMGATSEQGDDAGSDEKPAHSVTLDSYYIGVTEVTQELWQAVMGSNPSRFKGDNLPVEQVSWDDCQKFIQKLNQLTGQTFSLPTEAQWEFAARGGNLSRGYKYAGSNDLDSVTNESKDLRHIVRSRSETLFSISKRYNISIHRLIELNPSINAGIKVGSKLILSQNQAHLVVAQKQPNELGLYDMSGNVWEWCSDWYDSYSSSPQHNPQGPLSGHGRVKRGGSWFCSAWECQVSCRVWSYSDERQFDSGFRLALVSSH